MFLYQREGVSIDRNFEVGWQSALAMCRPSTTTKPPLLLFAAKENVNPVNFEKKERKGTTKILVTMKVSLIISREDHNFPPPPFEFRNRGC